MLTHLIKSINWVDVVLVVVFIRIIFIGIKNGFITEFFKTLGVLIAVFISLHYYSFIAAWVSQKAHVVWPYWDLLFFVLLWALVTIFFKFFRDGILWLFKIETTHEGFNKYAAGVIALARGILVCSLLIFSILLTYNGPLTRMTLRSYSYKITAAASVGTYSFLYKNLVARFSEHEHYNNAAPKVLHPDMNWSR